RWLAAIRGTRTARAALADQAVRSLRRRRLRRAAEFPHRYPGGLPCDADREMVFGRGRNVDGEGAAVALPGVCERFLDRGGRVAIGEDDAAALEVDQIERQHIVGARDDHVAWRRVL